LGIVGLSILSGVGIWWNEKGGGEDSISFINGVYISFGALTATGLTSHDITTMKRSSLNILLLGMQLGSMTNLSLIPVLIRIFYLRRIIPKEFRTFNLNNYQRVPEWMVEYKSLTILVRIVIAYQVITYLLFGSIMYLTILNSTTLQNKVIDESAANGDYFYWTIWHVVSAYCNVGFSLQNSSFETFKSNSPILLSMAGLVLFGNVLYPLLLRWIIIGMSAHCTKPMSSRKVYLRYLLLNGRHLYSSLFGSQQTWMLFIQQVGFFCFCFL